MVSSPLRYIGEEVIKCINCGSLNFKVSFYIYEAPLVGNILIEHGVCSECGYRKADVSIVDYGRPKTIKAFVKSRNDLNALVVKSSTATIMIPELGIEVVPGSAAYGYLTTIEGILEQVLDVIPSDCEERKECIDKVNLIKDAMNGSIKFTLIIKDPLGKSAVIGEDLSIVVEE
ncbi:MAG: ZPR1 zinc finger domain-containing protein [Sulfolobales archaeon]